LRYSGAKMPRDVYEGQRPARSVPHTSTVVLVALVLAAFVVGGLGTFAVLRYRAPRAMAAPAVVSSARVTAAVIETSIPVEALPPPSVPKSISIVTFPRSPISHRVWIDGVLVGSDAKPIEVGCGRRAIKIGSQGKTRVVDLPCGRNVTLD
jgi:hypothetical protein